MVTIELLDEEVEVTIEAYELLKSHSYNYGLDLNIVEQCALNKFKNARNNIVDSSSLINRLQDRVTVLGGKLRDMNKCKYDSIYYFEMILNKLYNADYETIDNELTRNDK
jgi:hypothetical protein